MEGIMMRYGPGYALAVRCPDGQIRTRRLPWFSLTLRPWLKKPFVRGCLLTASFLALFVLLLTPLFGDKDGEGRMTGLQYADSVFNELSKGSSYFVPAVRAQVDGVRGTMVDLAVSLKKADLAPLALRLVQTSGAGEASADGNRISFRGDLGVLLTSAVDDADNLILI